MSLRPPGRPWLATFLLIFLASQTAAQTSNSVHFIATREAPQNVLADSRNHRFYATVPCENAVYVIDESTGALLQTISVPSAYGLDLSPDGSRLYVTSSVTILGYPAVQGYFVVDTATLHVVDFVQPSVIRPTLTNSALPGRVNNVPRFIAALANGKVAYVAESTGITGGSVFLNDPATNLATPLYPNSFYDGALSKSADGSAFLTVSGDSAAENIGLYDAASATFVTNVRWTSTNGADVILSPDATRILVAGHYLLDRTLHQVADLSPATTSFAYASGGSAYSPDGTRIYVIQTTQGNPTNPVPAVYNASTLQRVGYIPLPTQAAGTGVQTIAVTNAAKVLFTSPLGFVELDAGAPAPLPTTNPPGTGFTVSPAAGSPTAPAPVTLSGSGSGFRPGPNRLLRPGPGLRLLHRAQPHHSPAPHQFSRTAARHRRLLRCWDILFPNAYSYGPTLPYRTSRLEPPREAPPPISSATASAHPPASLASALAAAPPPSPPSPPCRPRPSPLPRLPASPGRPTSRSPPPSDPSPFPTPSTMSSSSSCLPSAPTRWSSTTLATSSTSPTPPPAMSSP